MPISFDFPFWLTLIVIVTGVVTLLDVVLFAKKRFATQAKMPWYIDYSRAFFPALLAVWIIRSFLIQPYRVPTGSLEPTIMPGDFIAVKQYSYGVRLPVTHTKLFGQGEPKRGDIALFFWPVHPEVRFVKRVIGVPGDHITYKNKVLTVNGKEATQTVIGPAMNVEPGETPVPVIRKRENLAGVEHDIFVLEEGGWTRDFDITVPVGQYFMMGDNRDFSNDSRAWGFVPEANLIGQAFGVWLSWDSNRHWFRFDRMFKGVT